MAPAAVDCDTYSVLLGGCRAISAFGTSDGMDRDRNEFPVVNEIALVGRYLSLSGF
jgi:hypothetical protein